MPQGWHTADRPQDRQRGRANPKAAAHRHHVPHMDAREFYALAFEQEDPLPLSERALDRRMIRCLCLYGDRRRLPIEYAKSFLVMLGVFVAGSVAWVLYFWLAVHSQLSVINKYSVYQPATSVAPTSSLQQTTKMPSNGSACRYSMPVQRLPNPYLLQIFFALFCASRSMLFIPGILSLVARVQAHTHGFCYTLFFRLTVREGSLCIFSAAAVFFCATAFETPPNDCHDTEILDLYGICRAYFGSSCGVAASCTVLVLWHNALIAKSVDAGLESELRRRVALARDVIYRLKTVAYNPSLFGDEDGKPFGAECVICLRHWQQEDVIKLTPCTHAFHEECIRNWMSRSKTCAVCRQDLSLKHPSVDLHQTSCEVSPPPEELGVSAMRSV